MVLEWTTFQVITSLIFQLDVIFPRACFKQTVTLGLTRGWWWFPQSWLCWWTRYQLSTILFHFQSKPLAESRPALTLAGPVPGQGSCVPRPRQDMYTKEKPTRTEDNSFIWGMCQMEVRLMVPTSYDPENPRLHDQQLHRMLLLNLTSVHTWWGKKWNCSFCHFSGEIFRWEAFSNHSSLFSQPEA